MTQSPTVQVALPLALDKPLSYRVPSDLQGKVVPGVRVLVPLGRLSRLGVVVEVGSDLRENLRPVLEVLDDAPLVDTALLSFTRWVSEYYFSPWGLVLQAALPLALRLRVARHFHLLPAGREILENPFSTIPPRARRVLDLLARRGDLGEARVKRLLPGGMDRLLEDLEGRGWIGVTTESRIPGRRVRGDEWVTAVTPDAAPLRGAARRRALDFLHSCNLPIPLKEVCAVAKVIPSVIRAMAGEGRLTLQRRESRVTPSPEVGGSTPLVLTAHQGQAVARISEAMERGGFDSFLLEGVTGSGKTEVYLRGAEKSSALGRQALYLVPEIGLTPLLAQVVRSRFGESLAVLHSGLSEAQRWQALARIREGGVSLVVGTRSALFAPLPRLGLIVVDEEQDSSYDQTESPRYHARDAALVLGQRMKAVVVLGSATPSLESYAATRSGKLKRLVLPTRVQSRALPEVRLVDMREEFRARGVAALLSRDLITALTSLKASGDQGMLLLNRKGYATFLICRACGITQRCPSCSIAWTYHRVEELLICHYCNRRRSVPAQCPACGSQHLHLGGAGTQRLEETLRALDPSLRIARLDRDSAKGGRLPEILARFQRRELDLIVGTQMIAKGHDFPGVTLVGVLFADSLLAIPEFRAAERTYQLLSQVAGRAGRGERPGRVFIQAYDVRHPALVAAATHRPEHFFEEEMKLRRLAEYPPWIHLLQIRVEHRKEALGIQQAALLARRLRSVQGNRFKVLGPAPAPLARLKGRYRQQILLKGHSRKAMADEVRHLLSGIDFPRSRSGQGIIVEPDPRSLL